MNDQSYVQTLRRKLLSCPAWLTESTLTLTAFFLIASALGIGFLSSPNWPTGGDAASHLLYAWLYSDSLLQSGHVTPWVPEVFCGFPFLSYYFPLPFITMAVMSKLTGIAAAFKWGGFLAAMLLPGAVVVASRRWLKFGWMPSIFAALGVLSFILHEQNSIWGGNILSGLAGEFCYSYGILFLVLTMMAWSRAIFTGKGWILAAILEAACGFSHGFPLLIAGFSTVFLLYEGRSFKRTLLSLIYGHTLAFCLLGGWLWPMLEMHSLTVPNDGTFTVNNWQDMLPANVWPPLAAGIAGLFLCAIASVRRHWEAGQIQAARYFASGSGLAVVAFIGGSQLGFADVRFLPMAWLLGAIVCGWLFGQMLASLRTAAEFIWAIALTIAVAAVVYFLIVGEFTYAYIALFILLAMEALLCFPVLGRWISRRIVPFMSARKKSADANPSSAPDAPHAANPVVGYCSVLVMIAACSAQLGWISEHVGQAPDWGLWNHSGLEAKPQWHNLSQLIPYMKGDLWSPRLVFEHDPLNNDIGSTRTLEALPMFLNHRPVTEGLYMESTVLGPAVYQMQSEVSTQPSSPLARFPASSLDPVMAAKHMNLLHADTILLRSTHAKETIEQSGLFDKTAESLPFAVYKLKHFDSHLVEVLNKPVRLFPKKDWMQAAFVWFRKTKEFEAYQPVYGADESVPTNLVSGGPSKVREVKLSRHEMIFETEAVGRPHIIKVSYHPRWHLVSKGTLSIAAPGFMLLVPGEKEIHLVYGDTTVGKLGMLATTCSFLFLLLILWKVRRQAPAAVAPAETPANTATYRSWLVVFAAWIALFFVGLYCYTHSPEGIYQQAWVFMRAEKFDQAAERLEKSMYYRKSPAQKEEALFWLARARDNGGHRNEAKAALRELCDHYEGYWLPESMFVLSTMERQDGHLVEADALARRLREEYPNNQWTQKLQ